MWEIWVPHFSRPLREVGISLSFILEHPADLFLPANDVNPRHP
jgi:hypothetical protein